MLRVTLKKSRSDGNMSGYDNVFFGLQEGFFYAIPLKCCQVSDFMLRRYTNMPSFGLLFLYHGLALDRHGLEISHSHTGPCLFIPCSKSLVPLCPFVIASNNVLHCHDDLGENFNYTAE